MIPIVSIVGKSNSGKTTLIEKVIPFLTKKGYRIATIKHCAHGFEMDKEGKDTWKHKKAGAKAIVAVSDKKLALITDITPSRTLPPRGGGKGGGDRLKLEEIRERFIDDVDLIIAEGYKTERYQKIEVIRNGNSKKLLCTRDDNLIAVASDKKGGRGDFLLKGVPLIDINKPKDVARFIENRFLKNKKRPSIRKEKAYLFVNGRRLIIKPFVQEWFAKSIKAMVSTLRGGEKPKRIDISIED
ncbi:MAG: molybdopterin-guanine dinucleotide biosynthesis protein B [Nitrospirae bacterium]|nr:molybdopterin-guanine dinucleotide biosynthesis protein B [Nitrospirota bacterium]